MTENYEVNILRDQEPILPYNVDIRNDILSSMSVVQQPKYKTVREWHRDFSKKTGSEMTRKEYAKWLSRFCTWIELAPDALIIEARKQQEAQLPGKVWAETMALDFFDCMEQVGYSRSTCVAHYGGIRGFFRSNGILFIKKTPTIKGFVTRVRLDYFGERVKKMLKGADERMRFMILGLAQTGLSRKTFSRLTYGDVRADYERGEPRLYMEGTRKKTGAAFASFFHREATAALRLYMEMRQRNGENVTDATPLVVKKQQGTGKWVALTPKDVTREIGERAKAVGVHVTPHMFRKWFKTTCAPIIGDDAVRTMAAWEHPGVGGAYDLPPRSETLARHLKIEGKLTFEEQLDEKERRVQALVDNAIAMGMPVERAEQMRVLFKQKKYSPEQAAKAINAEMRGRAKQPQAGGVSFDRRLSDMLAEVIAEGVKKAAERLTK